LVPAVDAVELGSIKSRCRFFQGSIKLELLVAQRGRFVPAASLLPVKNLVMSIHHFTLATRDLQISSRFYQAVFNWVIVERPANISRSGVWLSIPGGQQLHLTEVPDFQPSQFEDEFGRHVALSVTDAELDEVRAKLIEQGTEIIPPQRDTPHRRFFFRDPDGYIIEVIGTVVAQ